MTDANDDPEGRTAATTAFELLGGEPAVRALVDRFYDDWMRNRAG